MDYNEIGKKVRKNFLVHEAYIADYCVKHYPPGTWRLHVRLGSHAKNIEEAPLTEEEKALFKLYWPYCDALAILENEVHIIEAYLRFEHGKIEQLLDYIKFFKITPEFKEHWNKPVIGILLTPLEDPVNEYKARQLGLRYVLYRPSWIIPYLLKVEKRKLTARFYAIKDVVEKLKFEEWKRYIGAEQE